MLAYIIASIFLITYGFSFWDKVSDFSSSTTYYKTHFGKTLISKYIKSLLIIICLVEFLLSVMFIIALIRIYINKNLELLQFAILINLILLLIFLIGQRIVKDYQGASNLINYISLSILSYLYIVFIY